MVNNGNRGNLGISVKRQGPFLHVLSFEEARSRWTLVPVLTLPSLTRES